MREVTIPKLNTVDLTCALVEWLFEDGDTVPADAAIAVIETSKAAEELVCETGGILRRLVEAPAECELGTVIGQVFEDSAERERFLAAGVPGASHPTPGAQRGRLPGAAQAEPVVTRYAQDLMTRHGISYDAIRGLGKSVVKSSDIEGLVSASGQRREENGGSAVSRAQRAVADAVSRAHSTIPAAFSVIKIRARDALALQRELADGRGLTAGRPELLVKCVALLHDAYPMIFSCVDADGNPEASAAAQIGVTVDVGTGLYIPVVRDAAKASIGRIANTLMEFRIKALRRQFRPSDLADGNIAISLHHDAAIVIAQPLIFPPHACMLALCADQDELFRDASGAVSARTYFYLGLAYDHRVINGRDADDFLVAIKDIFQSRERIAELAAGESADD